LPKDRLESERLCAERDSLGASVVPRVNLECAMREVRREPGKYHISESRQEKNAAGEVAGRGPARGGASTGIGVQVAQRGKDPEKRLRRREWKQTMLFS